MSKEIGTIAVDLTPILPGGENGGAKIFVIALLRSLARLNPKTQFVLLTQSISHEELKSLERVNVRCKMVLDSGTKNILRHRLFKLVFRLLAHLPARLKVWMGQLGYNLNGAIKRGRSRKLLQEIGADLLFCPFTATTYHEAGIPTVCTIYDLQYKTYPDFFSAEEFAHRDCTFMDACKRASALAAISDYSRDAAIQHAGLDPARICTIYLRMAKRFISEAQQDNSVLERYELAPQRYLIYPANFWKHKNHEMLLTAFGMACRGLPEDIKLVCTGAPGHRQTWLMGAARNMNLEDRVLFPGYLSDSEIAALMVNCRGVVFPSLYEGFGLPVIEAMATGVPVACSNTTSLPEIAAGAAILFDPRVPSQIAQAITALAEDETLRIRFVQAGNKRAREFTDSERMAREYWDLFQRALANTKHENLLTGVYADGWVGPGLSIQITPATFTQTLEVDLFAPEWLPQPKLTIQASLGGKSQGAPLEVARGTNAHWSLPLKSNGGFFEMKIHPTFVPALSGHGDDQREISALLQRCVIRHDDGESIELFSGKAST